MSLYNKLYFGIFLGSIGQVTISFPFIAPRYMTSTRSIKSCFVLKLPMNFVWSGLLKELSDKKAGTHVCTLPCHKWIFRFVSC